MIILVCLFFSLASLENLIAQQVEEHTSYHFLPNAALFHPDLPSHNIPEKQIETLDGMQTRYRLYCYYTPKFKYLYENYFLPSIKDDFEVKAFTYPEECLSGNFMEDGWDRVMLQKLAMLEVAIQENWQQVFIYSDIDIIFFKPILDIALKHLGSNDLAAQKGWPKNKICAGFLIMRGNERTLNLVKEAYRLLEQNAFCDDQAAIRALLESNELAISWTFLPIDQFPNGRYLLLDEEGYYSTGRKVYLTKEIALIHANCCIGLENKYHFMNQIIESNRQLH